MRRRTFVTAIASLAIAALGAPGATLANDDMKLSGPFTHDNLAVYFVHGASAGGPVPLTLQEALAKGAAHVYETGQVNELFVENAGEEAVFIQAGDIVKGGQQDRVLTVSMLLTARSGRVPIAAFCVEQGRWAARGREDVARFASAAESMPSRAAKLALKEAASGGSRQAAAPEVTAGLRPAGLGADIAQRRTLLPERRYDGQSEIWSKVAETQRKLGENLAAAVASRESATSLQLSLENQKVQEARAAYTSALDGKGTAEADVVGVVVAVNGRISSAEIYPSNGLFRKMWGKVLTAAATEAISEQKAPNGPAPAASAVKQFIADAEQGKADQRELPMKVKLETRSTDKAIYSLMRSEAGVAYHRSLVAR